MHVYDGSLIWALSHTQAPILPSSGYVALTRVRVEVGNGDKRDKAA